MGLLLSLKRDRLWMPKKTRKTGRKLPLFLMLKSEKFLIERRMIRCVSSESIEKAHSKATKTGLR